MRRGAALVLITVACALPACGDNKSDTGSGSASTPTASSTATESASPSASPSASVGVVLAKEELDAVLLTAADLGAGFTADAPTDADDEESTPSPGSTPTKCSLEQLERELEDPLYGREVGLASQQALISNQAEVYGPGVAAEAFTTTRARLGECSTMTETDPDGGDTTTLKVAPLDVASVGDETIAVQLTDDSPDGISGGLVMFRRGDVVVTVAGFGEEGAPLELMRTAVTKAAAKLDAAVA